MILEDVVVSKTLSDREIKAGITAALQIAPEHIAVVSEIPSDKLHNDLLVMCQKLPLSGDFPLQISIYVRDQSLETIDVADAMERFCQATDSSVLISDDDGNPYSRILINKFNQRKKVFLDPESLDELNRFVVKPNL